MAGPDPLDPRTGEVRGKAQPARTRATLKPDALKGKRFGVPAFILDGVGIPFHGVPAAVPDDLAARAGDRRRPFPCRPRPGRPFMKAVEELRAAGATVVIDDTILPESFAQQRHPRGYLSVRREGLICF